MAELECGLCGSRIGVRFEEEARIALCVVCRQDSFHRYDGEFDTVDEYDSMERYDDIIYERG